jgi:hypothetical protein
MNDLSQTTFVCCVEPGPLESMATRLVQSVRRHGGRFADAPVVVCQPRFGPKIGAATLRELRALKAEYLRLPNLRRFGWYHYLNKGVALAALERRVTTEWVTFVDSDILIAQEPSELVGTDVDFIACAPDTGLVGSTGPGSRYDAAWLNYIARLDLDPAAVPMIREHETGQTIRFYFNSGLFSYRRSTGFAQAYRQAIADCLHARLGFPDKYEHYTDQVVLGLVALKLGLRWRALPASYNLTIDRDRQALPDSALKDGRVLHYHKGLAHAPEAMFGRLRSTHPELAAWLEPLGAIDDPRPASVRAASELLRIVRGVPRRIHRRQIFLKLAG